MWGALCVKARIKMSSANSRIIRKQKTDKNGPRNNANIQAYDAVLFFEKLHLQL